MRLPALRRLAAIGAILASTSCLATAAWAGGTLTIGIPSMPTGNPITQSGGNPDILATNVIGEGLTRWTRDSLEVEPALATSWEPNADASEWTFKLRQGVKWHDGQPFTAEDVKFTFELIVNKDVRAAAAGQVPGLQSVEIVAPDTVVLKFAQPSISLPAQLAYRMPIAPKHLLEGQDPNAPTEFVRQPVGTGPFKFDAAASGQYWSAVRNPDWWGGEVSLDEVTFAVTPDANSVVAQLRAGNMDIARVRPSQIAALEGDEIEVQAAAQPTVFYLALMNNKAPFDDVRVRRALNHAVDKQAIVTAVVEGYAVVADGVVPAHLPGYTGDVTQYEYDPAKAKALLVEAGWTEQGGVLVKDGKPLEIELTTSTGILGGPQLAQIIQGQFAEIGVGSTINLVDFRALWTGVFDGQFSTSVEYLTQQPSAQTMINTLICNHGRNRFAHCDPELDKLIIAANGIVDDAERNAVYATIQQKLADNPPGIWLYFPQEVRAVNRRVQGFSTQALEQATTRLFETTIKD